MIANSTAISDQFVPLALPGVSSGDPAFSSLSLRVRAQAPATPGGDGLTAAPADSSRSPGTCSKPVVTLQRKGDNVSGIRIQCGCGNVIELTCLH